MNHNIKISVYQHPTFDEGQVFFKEDVESVLFNKCETVFLKKSPDKIYPKEEVEKRFAQLLQTVSMEKTITITITGIELSWKALLERFERYYPQMVWTLGKVSNDGEMVYSFQFIPLVKNDHGFPFGTNLAQSIVQQGIPDEGNPIEEWEKEIYYVVEDCIVEQVEVDSVESDSVEVDSNEEEESPSEIKTDDEETSQAEEVQVPVYKKDEFYSGQDIQETQESEQALKRQNDLLKEEYDRLEEANKRLEEKIAHLREQATTQPVENEVASNSTELNKQALYYEEALRRERDAKERMRLSREKLEHLVNRLERQVMDNSLDILEGDLPYVDRSQDWHKKTKIDIVEYDQLYQKAKYLEHTWQVNQRLILISERMTMTENEVKYERERVNQIKYSSRDIELFVMMDECKMINERVKIRKGFLWLKPCVVILKGDYENLVEKAAYFDVIQSENQLLERIIEEHGETTTTKTKRKITGKSRRKK